MNRNELVNLVADRTGLDTVQAAGVVTAFVDAVVGEIRSGGKVAIDGFGTFVTSSQAARQGRNPQTGEAVAIDASIGVRFAPAPSQTRALNTGIKIQTAHKGSSARRPQTAGHRRSQRYDSPLEGSVGFMRDVKTGKLAPVTSKKRQPKAAEKSTKKYDDRKPSRSVRTVSGGLPGHGKRQ
ncbi:MAG: HU family DNA-binding protein [Actinomycetota bacterium]|nr:HU family DNA-binding protein [Actinomycetota bacterium]